MFNPGDVVAIDFPGVTGVKRRPVVVVSSSVYHASRPDVVVCLITSQTSSIGPTDCVSQIGLRQVCDFLQSFDVFSQHSPPLPILCSSAICQIAIGREYVPA